MENIKGILFIVGVLLLAAFLIGVGPLITIWTLNTLFMKGAIAYTFKTWLATGLLHMTVAGLMKAGKS